MKQVRGNDMIEEIRVRAGTPALRVAGLYGFGMRRRSVDG